MVKSGIPAEEILILLPQRTLATPYSTVIDSLDFPPGGRPDILTLGGLAQRSISLFWPLISTSGGFNYPAKPPAFLTIETAQFFMARIVDPFLRQGYFGSITLQPNRLYSQLLDNLNKSALVGFPYTGISERLRSAWNGASSQLRLYDQAQEAIHSFRQYCLENNLLDFSLQLELFLKHLWPTFLCRKFLTSQYRHLIFDNVEEDTPVCHDLILDWLPDLDSSMFIMDDDAGYRKFLGSDPISALRLKDHCSSSVTFTAGMSLPIEYQAFQKEFSGVLGLSAKESTQNPETLSQLDENTILNRIRPLSARFFPKMLDSAIAEVSLLVNEKNIPPGQIAILAPYLSDRLRFGLTERLSRLGIPTRVLRPSRSLQENNFSGCLLTLARLAHPGWELEVVKPDFIQMLNTTILGLDLCRAGLLADVVFRRTGNVLTLGDFSIVKTEMKDRVTYLAVERYEQLRKWIELYRSEQPIPLEDFFSRIFGELLTQSGFGFHNRLDAGEVTANLMESARKFRQAVQTTLEPDAIAREFIHAVESGLVSAQYLRTWEILDDQSVIVAPAFTFLLQNCPVDYQVWLDAGSNAWFERLEQPLTHPYVLSRQWISGTVWDDTLENNANRATLNQLISGLLRRCTGQVILLHSELNEQGFDQQGVLMRSVLMAFRRMLKRSSPIAQVSDGDTAHV